MGQSGRLRRVVCGGCPVECATQVWDRLGRPIFRKEELAELACELGGARRVRRLTTVDQRQGTRIVLARRSVAV
ncbi:MAG TPA: hypothetical protein VFD69_18980, partial [Vicinamibacterales bacterium]|nr:hypothetical protein [Vicinamibacterales bacterium]